MLGMSKIRLTVCTYDRHQIYKNGAPNSDSGIKPLFKLSLSKKQGNFHTVCSCTKLRYSRLVSSLLSGLMKIVLSYRL